MQDNGMAVAEWGSQQLKASAGSDLQGISLEEAINIENPVSVQR